MNDTTKSWRDVARKKLESIRGLSDKHPPFAIGREELQLETAIALEDAVDRLVGEGVHLSESIGGATDRLVTANKTSVDAAGKLTTDMIKAVNRLVDASNGNTAVMSRLQRWVIGLTIVYVVLTGVIAWATYVAATQNGVGSP